MPRFLDLDTWPRAEHFSFYRTFDRPFFNVCVQVDVAPLKTWTDAHDVSFFLATLYVSQQAVHKVEPFRYRMRGERVLVRDTLDAGSTVLRDDETFAFAYFEHADTFAAFHRQGQSVIASAKASSGLTPGAERDDLIHYSVLPWLHFTSFSNARSGDPTDSIPKIVFGRYTPADDEALQMPVSIAVHHALVDGLHVGRYVETLRRYCAAPEECLVAPE